MAKTRGKKGERKPRGLTTRKMVWDDGFVEVEHLHTKIETIVERLIERIIELEAMGDFYAWGPSPKGELEPMRGEEYVKAIAKDGGKIARAYLKERIDRGLFGAAHKDAPAGWGVDERYAALPKSKPKSPK
jgi:hypothetical protein